jgi:hypothetical protein
MQAIQTAKAIIVDITALATLRLLGLTKILSSTKYRFVLSQATWIALHEMLSTARASSAPSTTLSYENGKHVIYEQNTAEKEQASREDEESRRLSARACLLWRDDGLRCSPQAYWQPPSVPKRRCES